ncbi:MAG: hypothetical protein CSA11_11335 [Chloroflexi bacterium]|nr:MAG: hypothetical protein CSB13_03145 [Chloroflexota bacterium]PIE79700.1 MAG: hypothetical protein CSA11_11335 [Chloroflexota bacterium]
MLKQLIVISLILLLLTACGNAKPTPTPAATAVLHTATPAQPTDTPTPEPTNTPRRPTLSVSDQPLNNDGLLVIDNVTVLEPAWVVIHAEHDGQVGEVLGQTAVTSGTNSAVEVVIEPLQATDTLTAMIHHNAGSKDSFDFPGEDDPLLENGSTVAQSFAINRQMQLPEIQASDQDVLEDGLIAIDNVRSPGPGWVVVYTQEADAIGTILGFTSVQAGTSENIVVPIPWREATPHLYIMLHADTGREQHFDFPEEDLPVLAIGEPVAAEIEATFPPQAVIFDQPVINNQIVVERVVSNGPGWVAVYADDGGSPGIIIGSAPLDNGLNEFVPVKLSSNQITEELFVFLHIDKEPGDKFDFIGGDFQVVYQGRIAHPFSFNTNPGNYLITEDQALQEVDGETAVTLPYAITDSSAWVVIYTNDDGELGDIIGQTWLAPGINRDVTVTIDSETITDSLFAVLHWDAGTTKDFEPLGSDVPFQRNRRIIQSPFAVTSE